MKIGTQLTLRFVLMAAAIIIVYASVVWYAASSNREKEFYKLLEKEAVTKANLFFDAGIDAQTLQEIYKNNRKVLNEVEVAIYSTNFKLLYHDAVEIDVVKETPEMLKVILNNGQISFYQQHWQVIGIQYIHQNQTYLITAAAFDDYGYTKLTKLLRNSILVFVFSLLFIYLAAVYFSKQILTPIQLINQRARMITATNLDLRLPQNNNQDELAELSHTINDMLLRLEQSFESQKAFVSNISHELRTPLTAIIAEIELALQQNISRDGYKQSLMLLQADAQRLVKLSNALLDLAKASYDTTEIFMKPLRVDELLMDTCAQLQAAHPQYTFSIAIDEQNEDVEASTLGNAYLLGVAFGNLIENACKYGTSPQCSIKISIDTDSIKMVFVDDGQGISHADMPHIFEPFYRSTAQAHKSGYGIGLSLTQRIVLLHKGHVEVLQTSPNGTQVQLVLPRF
jgi:two-component system sensor histidine kinase ArlS